MAADTANAPWRLRIRRHQLPELAKDARLIQELDQLQIAFLDEMRGLGAAAVCMTDDQVHGRWKVICADYARAHHELVKAPVGRGRRGRQRIESNLVVHAEREVLSRAFRGEAKQLMRQVDNPAAGRDVLVRAEAAVRAELAGMASRLFDCLASRERYWHAWTEHRAGRLPEPPSRSRFATEGLVELERSVEALHLELHGAGARILHLYDRRCASVVELLLRRMRWPKDRGVREGMSAAAPYSAVVRAVAKAVGNERLEPQVAADAVVAQLHELPWTRVSRVTVEPDDHPVLGLLVGPGCQLPEPRKGQNTENRDGSL